ncbi:hypothetical protein Y1Q_0015696 [Alligator mississippiensis]|uniref:Uncharacterized protein n=1 Tax=Alligator mississippiensis TaxID=8496 RepID=A0A151NNP0_ALLMI|nr:hypothetical protein Y1Q_0015696 [Alligator mississippiensis]
MSWGRALPLASGTWPGELQHDPSPALMRGGRRHEKSILGGPRNNILRYSELPILMIVVEKFWLELKPLAGPLGDKKFVIWPNIQKDFGAHYS